MDNRLVLTIVVISLQSALVLGQNDICRTSSCQDKITAIKEHYASTIGANPDVTLMSTCLAGNQCWDCEIVNKVYQQLLLSTRAKRQAYNFTADPRRQWSLPISYLFDNTIASSNSAGSDAKSVIRNAISYVEAQTCIRFTEINQPISQSYISFGLGTSCVSFVGRTLDANNCPIEGTASCLTQFGQMLYLIVQTLGVWHESQRFDRDNYITILIQNVISELQGDFGILDPSLQLLQTYGLPYDYASLMQFPSKIFTSNGNYTILTNDPLYQRTIGQRVQLSFQDTKLLNLMYCAGTCSNQSLSSPCQNGGYQNPNNCNTCHCPDGYSGTFCTDLEPAQGAVCGGTLTATNTEQIITSPGYYTPGYYDSQVKCAWRINAPAGNRIKIRFFGDFGIYCNDDACYHWVEVRYTGQMNNTGPRFCCNNLPSANLVSSQNQILVVFLSNVSGIDSSHRRGFQLAYSLSGTGSPCDSNPCHNNGICTVNTTSSTGFSCTCPTGLSGPLCQNGCCGGCNSKPGMPQAACVANENPLRMCNVTSSQGSTSSRSSHRSGRWGFSRQRRHMPRFQIIQVPCTIQFCCENAQLIGIPNSNPFCSVSGWSDWSTCPSSCGGDYQTKSFYSIRQQYTVDRQAYNVSVITNTTTVACNVQPCQCSSYGWFSWFRPRRCSACNAGFVQQGSSCQPA